MEIVYFGEDIDVCQIHLQHCSQRQEEGRYVQGRKCERVGIDQVDYYELRTVSRRTKARETRELHTL